MSPSISGATRLHVIVGDPITQVRSPGDMTAAFAVRGYDGIVVPVRVAAADLDGFMASAGRVMNLDGIIVTVPHKFAACRHRASVTERAAFLGAVNLLRRRADGAWHGEAATGTDMYAALEEAMLAFLPAGERIGWGTRSPLRDRTAELAEV